MRGASGRAVGRGSRRRAPHPFCPDLPGAVPPFGSERPVSVPVAPLLPVVGGGVSGRRVEFTARSVSFPGRETGLFGFFRTSFRQSHINSCMCNRMIINVLKIRGGDFRGKKAAKIGFFREICLPLHPNPSGFLHRGQRMVLLYGRGCNWLIDMYLSVSRGAKGISV